MTTETSHIEAPAKISPEGWTNAPDIQDLQQNFNDSKSYHDIHVGLRNEYLDSLNITGSVRPKTRKGFSKVQPKTIRKHAEWRYSALSEAFLSTPDMFTLKPRTHRDKLTVRQNQTVLNYQWNNLLNKVAFVDEYVRTAVDEGTAFIRLGWESIEEEFEEEVEIYDYLPATTAQQVMDLRQAAMLQQQDPYSFKGSAPEHIQEALRLTEQEGQPIYPVLTGTQLITATRMLKNQPTIEVCNSANLYVDPSCNGDLDKAEFAIYSYETSKSDLRKAGTEYKNLDLIQANTSSLLASPDHEISEDDSFNFKDDPRTKFVAYEYWGYWDVDGSGMTTPFVATWVGNVLIRLEANPYPDQKIPFLGTQYLPVRKSAYGQPDGVLLKDNQTIIGAVTRGAIDIMARSAAGQKGIREDALDVINQRKFDLGLDFKFNPMVDPSRAIIDFNYPEIPNSVGLMLNMQETDANNMSGVRPFGATDSSAGTATADRGVLDAATKRETAILRRFGSTMQEVAKKIIAMNGEFLSDEEIIRVTDEDFVAIKREDLGGNFDIEVSISTAEEDAAKAEELAFMMQTIGPNDDPAIRRMIQADIARLRKMPNLAKRIEDFKPEPDPVQQKIQQLELAKLELELAELQAKTVKLQTAAQLDMAKVSESGVKAGNIQSDTDNKNLQFVEQQNGTNHARNMEQDQAQAKGNMALAILQNDLDKDLQSDTPTT